MPDFNIKTSEEGDEEDLNFDIDDTEEDSKQCPRKITVEDIEKDRQTPPMTCRLKFQA